MTMNVWRGHRAWRSGLVLMGCMVAAGASSAQGVDRQARAWAASCAACHGSEGRAQGAIPSIAGRDAGQLYNTLIEFNNNQRPAATVMHQHTKGYSDDELRRIASYFAAQPATAP